jgi:hypothetical protein
MTGTELKEMVAEYNQPWNLGTAPTPKAMGAALFKAAKAGTVTKKQFEELFELTLKREHATDGWHP